MSLRFTLNPSRQTFWWELIDESGSVLLLGSVKDSLEDAQTEAEPIRAILEDAA
jgi:hypothetical protein